MCKQQINLDDARSHVSRMLTQIREARSGGRYKRARHLSQVYLRSYDARYLAVKEAYRALDKHRRPGVETLQEIAHRLNAWEGSGEEVLLILKEKPNHHYRDIKDFGIEHRSLQYLCRPLLQAQAKLHPDQYGLVGTHKAVLRVAELMTQGYTWARETDLTDCYSSFDGAKVPGLLPLPTKVTRRCLLCVSLNMSLGNNSIFGPEDFEGENKLAFPEVFSDARRGFPQGSATSAIAIEMLLAPVFAQLPKEGKWVGYSDNTLAMAKSESDVVSMNQALWSSLKVHPAGHLQPKLTGVFSPGQPIEFLGHRLTLCGGGVHIEPSPKNQAKFEMTLAKRLVLIKNAPGPLTRKRRAYDCQRYVRSWCAAFSLWPEWTEFRANAMTRINHAAGH